MKMKEKKLDKNKNTKQFKLQLNRVLTNKQDVDLLRSELNNYIGVIAKRNK